MKEIVVLGAGLMGLTTAYWLRRAGAEVHVVDGAAGPGTGTSFANGGMLTPSQANPWNGPGITRYALSSIGAKDSPFFVHAGAVPALARWGVEFFLHSRAASFARNARRNYALGRYSLDLHHRILADTGIDCGQRRTGTMQVFRDEPSLAAAEAIAEMLRPAGLDSEVLRDDALMAKEPALADCAWRPCGGLFFPADESGDAHAFCLGLAEWLRANGVRFTYDFAVDALIRRRDTFVAAQGPRGTVEGAAFVMAMAAESVKLLRPHGVRLPIYPVKGYSLTIDQPAEGRGLQLPIVDMYRKVALTPFDGRLRIAGTAEFGGYDRTVHAGRAATLLNDAAAVLPWLSNIAVEDARPWCGLRPVTPSGFPVHGRWRDNLFVNAGHGPLGWTFAAGSGRLTADLVLRGGHDLEDDVLIREAIRA